MEQFNKQLSESLKNNSKIQNGQEWVEALLNIDRLSIKRRATSRFANPNQNRRKSLTVSN